MTFEYNEEIGKRIFNNLITKLEENRRRIESIEEEKRQLKDDMRSIEKLLNSTSIQIENTVSDAPNMPIKLAITQVLVDADEWLNVSDLSDAVATLVWSENKPKSYRIGISQRAKALSDAGTIERKMEGNRAYYRRVMAIETKNPDSDSIENDFAGIDQEVI